MEDDDFYLSSLSFVFILQKRIENCFIMDDLQGNEKAIASGIARVYLRIFFIHSYDKK